MSTDRREHWVETREQLRALVDRYGADSVAAAIPAGRTTVYRLVGGATQTPSRAVQKGIERVLRQAAEGHYGKGD